MQTGAALDWFEFVSLMENLKSDFASSFMLDKVARCRHSSRLPLIPSI